MPQKNNPTPKSGWNRSSGADAVPKRIDKRPSPVRGILAGVVVVILACITLWILFGRNAAKDLNDKTGKSRSLIQEVQPAKAATNALSVAKVEAPKELPPQKIGEIRDGYVKLPSGRLHRVKGIHTNKTAYVKSKYEIFQHRCDNEIAALLSLKPGGLIFGTPRYNGKFKQEFIESLKTPIIVTQDDSPEDAALKRSVNEAKIELKAALDRGEDIEQIMLDTRKELQDLGRYKMEIQHELNDFRKKEGVTTEDVEDFVKACNTMLEKKGIAPLNLGPFTKKKLMHNTENISKQE